MRKIINGKLVAGIILIIIGIVLITGVIEFEPPAPTSSFSSEPIQVSGFEDAQITEDSYPKKVIIPSVDIYLDVRKAELINGYWEVFEETAGWGAGSGVPGMAGNQVIFAHAREGLFAPLKDIEENMTILVLTENHWFEYKVTTIGEVYPGNTKYIEQSENEILTLYTCSGYRDSKRLIVKAERV